MQDVDPASSSSGRSWSSTRRSTTLVREPRVAAVLLDDEQRRRLLAAPVAAGGLGCVEAVEQPLGEWARERSKVSAIASTVSAETRMLPCAA